LDIQAGGGGAKQGVARDTDDRLDEGLPLGFGQCVTGGKDLHGAILLAGAAFRNDKPNAPFRRTR